MKLECICPQCKKIFQMYPFELQRGRKFCSRACQVDANTVKGVNIFETNTNNSAYLLGLIWTDGNIYTGKKHSTMLDISLKDFQIIQDIQKIFLPNSKIYETHPKHGNTIYSLKTKDKNIIKSLIQLGLVEQKTYIAKWPLIDFGVNLPHFIRGAFDGDGSVFKNIVDKHPYLHLSFTGYRNDFFENLFVNLEQFGPKWVKDSRENSTWYIKIYAREMVKKFANYIYNEDSLCLTRKKNVFLSNGYLS